MVWPFKELASQTQDAINKTAAATLSATNGTSSSSITLLYNNRVDPCPIMKLVLSKPIMSYLLSPSLATWSTSLNVLLFNMTWAVLVLSHSPLLVHIGGTFAIRVVFWLIPSLVSLVFDVIIPPNLTEHIKYCGRASLPPRHPRELCKLLGLALFNLVVVTATEGILSYCFQFVRRQSAFDASTTLPPLWLMAKQILILILARQVCRDYIHRQFLHGPEAVTEEHVRYHHHRRASPFSLMLMTDHPFPIFLHHLLPIYLPALALRSHLITYFIFVTICIIEETISMCGYTILPGMVWRGVAKSTAIHYASKGTTNFGSWGVLDWIYKTSQGGDILRELKARASKAHFEQAAARGMGGKQK